MKYICPVCGFPNLHEPAYEGTSPSFEICPSCGTEFGYQDATTSHEQLRSIWISDGCKWWSKDQRPPTLWNPQEQLSNVRDLPSD